MENDQTLQQHYERLVELCQIHRCLHRYCLKEVKPKKDEEEKLKTNADLRKEHVVKGKNEKDKDTLYQCRFGYPEELYGYEATYHEG